MNNQDEEYRSRKTSSDFQVLPNRPEPHTHTVDGDGFNTKRASNELNLI